MSNLLSGRKWKTTIIDAQKYRGTSPLKLNPNPYPDHPLLALDTKILSYVMGCFRIKQNCKLYVAKIT